MTKEEALTLEALKYAASLGNGRIVREMNTAPFIIRCEEALAQPEKPEHEPVGDLLRDFAEQYIKEDEAVVSSINRLMTLGRKMSDAILFAPPQRPWVGLTEEETDNIRFSIPATHHTEFDRKFTRAIEAKLKEKNT